MEECTSTSLFLRISSPIIMIFHTLFLSFFSSTKFEKNNPNERIDHWIRERERMCEREREGMCGMSHQFVSSFVRNISHCNYDH
jgi:hypothetical protein